MIRSLASTVATLHTSMTNLEAKLGQISDIVNQTIPNNPTPNLNISVVTTRSGRELKLIVKNPAKKSTDKEVVGNEGDEAVVANKGEFVAEKPEVVIIEDETEKVEETPMPPIGSPVYDPRPPFSGALLEMRKLDSGY